MRYTVGTLIVAVVVMALAGCGGEHQGAGPAGAMAPRSILGVAPLIGDEFDSMANWVEYPHGSSGQLTVSGGQLHLENRTADGPFGYNTVTAAYGEADVDARVRSENGWIEIGVGEAPDGVPIADELYASHNAARPANGVSVFMCFTSQPETWWVYQWVGGAAAPSLYTRVGHNMYDPAAWHSVTIRLRTSSVEVVHEGNVLGSLALDPTFAETRRRLWIGAENGNAHIDYIRVYPVSVADAEDPVIGSLGADPQLLWPPDKKTVSVNITGTITDNVAVSEATLSVADEYGELTAAPLQITLGAGGAFSVPVQLVRWRRGDDRDGRAYTITVTASDTSVNQSSATVSVTVPHDMR